MYRPPPGLDPAVPGGPDQGEIEIEYDERLTRLGR
jgi:hypothetical protein